MNTVNRFAAVAALLFAVGIVGAEKAQAGTYYLRGQDGGGLSSMNGKKASENLDSGWADTPGGTRKQTDATAGNVYHVGTYTTTGGSKASCLLRTPSDVSGDYTFLGDEIVMEGGQLAHKSAINARVTVGKLTAKAGLTSQVNIATGFGSAGTQGFNGTLWTIEDGATLLTALNVGQDSSVQYRSITFATKVAGAGTWKIEAINPKNYYPSVTYDCDMSEFTGKFDISGPGMVVTFVNSLSLAAGPAEVDAASVSVSSDGVKLAFTADVESAATRGWSLGSQVTIDVGAGASVIVHGPIVAANGFTKTGAGTLILAGDTKDVDKSKVTVSGGEVLYEVPTPQELYVDPKGDDAAAGTIDAPLRTIKCAYDKVRGIGDAIYLKDGTYLLEKKYDKYTNGLNTYTYGLCLWIKKNVKIVGLSKDPTKVILDAQSLAKLMVMDNERAELRFVTLQNGYVLEPKSPQGAGSDMGGNLRLNAGRVSYCILKDGAVNGLGGNVTVGDKGCLSCSVISGGYHSAAAGGGQALFVLGGLVENCLITNVRRGEPNQNPNSACVSIRQGAMVVNCTIAGNLPNTNIGAATIHERDNETGNKSRYINCAFYDNDGKDWFNSDGENYRSQIVNCAAAAEITGWDKSCKVISNPGFVDAANGDYTLQKDSALIDQGDTSLYLEKADTKKDFSGKRRIFGSAIDIGACEWRKPGFLIFLGGAAKSVPAGPQALDARFPVANDAVNGKVTIVGVDWTFPNNHIVWDFDATTEKGLPYNKEWTCQLNRMGFWNDLAEAYQATGDERYAAAFAQQAADWLEQSGGTPPDANKNADYKSPFRTIEEGLRLMQSWATAWTAFADSPSFTDSLKQRFKESMHAQALHLWKYKSTASANNWLLMEMCGIYTYATLFPSESDSATLRGDSATAFCNAIAAQLLPDGLQYELSPDYHHVFYMTAAQIYEIARQKGYTNELSDDYVQILERGADATLRLMTPGFVSPAFNDSYNTPVSDVLGPASGFFPLRTDFLWAATKGAEGEPPVVAAGETASHYFPYAGFAVMRTDWSATASYLAFDVGPLGMNHVHQDKLGFTLWKGDEELVFDDGGGQYDTSEERAYAVTGFDHNVLEVDGLVQNRTTPGKVDSPIDAQWTTSAAGDSATGVYNQGYGPNMVTLATHTRKIDFDRVADTFTITDDAVAVDDKTHSYVILFHVDSTDVTISGNKATVRYGKKWDLELTVSEGGTITTASSWYVGRHGTVPDYHLATTIRVSAPAAEKDHCFITVLRPVTADI